MEYDRKPCAPKVSIGMPVFNGENYLAVALESILAQTFSDFELIVCDNASTDATGRICRDYVARDDRIRYYRNERNSGAIPNFNRTFELARGAYFKWAAHDDVLAPTYLEQCVRALDTDPDAALCHTLVCIIDERGRELATYDSGLRGTEAARASRRFAAMVLIPHLCTEVFALFRAKALARSKLYTGAYGGCDRALLAELCLIGRFITVAEPLFMNRDHGERYSRAVSSSEQAAWHNSTQVRRVCFPTWQLYRDYGRAVRRHVETPRERLRCYGYLLRWWGAHWNTAHILLDLAAAMDVRIYTWAARIKAHLFGPRPLFLGSTLPAAKGKQRRIKRDR